MPQLFQRFGLDILMRASQHLWLSLPAVAIAIIIGGPLGFLAARNAQWRKPILGFAALFRILPALAIFGFLLPILGFGTGSVLVAIALLSSSPIIRDIFDGLTEIDADVRETARAIGMTPAQILRRVELPLAAAQIVAGAREAVVLSLGLTAIAAFFGAGGLGNLIRDGLRASDNAMILAGAIPIALLALGADQMLAVWQQILAARRTGKCEIAPLQRVLLWIGASVLTALTIGPPLIKLFSPAR